MNTIAISNTQTSAGIKTSREGYLFNPVIDFLGLGGASLIAMVILIVFDTNESIKAEIAFSFMAIAHIINHPHFAHSYQIFYRDFKRKIGADTAPNLRWRYWFAGIVAPLAIAAFYTTAVTLGNTELIGLSINLMLFLVGWHYVKQGYGMLSVDSVLKKKFFTEGEKKLLLWNAYAVWAFSYVYANMQAREVNYFGIGNYTISFPEPVLWLTLAIMIALSLATIIMFARRASTTGKGVPFNGFVAYVVSLYIWLLAVNYVPLFLFVVPAFHSLQYMMVTTRFQLNVEKEKADNGYRSILNRVIKDAPVAALFQFYIVGAVLGYLAFWGLPNLIATATDLGSIGFPYGWAFTVFWVFVNVHHYLLDNVMWRKGNPDVAKHLFAHH